MTLDELHDKAWSENPEMANLHTSYTDKDGRIWPSVKSHDEAITRLSKFHANFEQKHD